jgi:4a-hydroxytetrahydrobiopterin dehydratase|nr:MAG: hypothetical protein KatS3mg041_1990 [Bacteroidota bacterium]
MARPLQAAQIEAALRELKGWSLEGNKLVREFRFRSFPEALSFLIRVGFEAERLGHHPEIYNVYATVRLALTTHEAGSQVTERDLELARAIDRFSWV